MRREVEEGSWASAWVLPTRLTYTILESPYLTHSFKSLHKLHNGLPFLSAPRKCLLE